MITSFIFWNRRLHCFFLTQDSINAHNGTWWNITPQQLSVVGRTPGCSPSQATRSAKLRKNLSAKPLKNIRRLLVSTVWISNVSNVFPRYLISLIEVCLGLWYHQVTGEYQVVYLLSTILIQIPAVLMNKYQVGVTAYRSASSWYHMRDLSQFLPPRISCLVRK